jgi:hypothetical protein
MLALSPAERDEVDPDGVDPSTSSLQTKHSTVELRARLVEIHLALKTKKLPAELSKGDENSFFSI